MSNFHPNQSPADFDFSAPFAYPHQQSIKRQQSYNETILSPYSSLNLLHSIPSHSAYLPRTYSFTRPTTFSLPLVPTSSSLISPSTGIIPALLQKQTPDLEKTETVDSGTHEVEKDANLDVTECARKRGWASSTTIFCGADRERGQNTDDITIEPVIKKKPRKTYSCKSCRYAPPLTVLRNPSACSFLQSSHFRKRKVRCDRTSNCSTCKARGEPCVWGGTNGIK